MSVTINGVPEGIARDAFNQLVESLGLSLDNLVSLDFSLHGVRAVVFALDEHGRRFVADPRDREAATHTIIIPIVDDAAPQGGGGR